MRMMPWKSVIACALMLITLSGCETGSRGINNFCLLYQPVYHSKKDTEETKASIDVNNAIWLEKCDKKK